MTSSLATGAQEQGEANTAVDTREHVVPLQSQRQNVLYLPKQRQLEEESFFCSTHKYEQREIPHYFYVVRTACFLRPHSHGRQSQHWKRILSKTAHETGASYLWDA